MLNEGLQSICAYCKREMFTDPLSGTTVMGQVVPPEKQVRGVHTHGICQECMQKMTQNIKPMQIKPRRFGEWLSQKSKGT